jgi:hypothetical protein
MPKWAYKQEKKYFLPPPKTHFLVEKRVFSKICEKRDAIGHIIYLWQLVDFPSYFFLPPMETRCEKVRRYILPPAIAGVA